MNRTVPLERKPLLAAVVVTMVILYGSLFPFAFHGNPLPIPELLLSAQFRPSRIDFVANVILYVPLGVCLFLVFRSWTTVRRVLAASVLGFLISLGVEITQTFDTGRYASVFDVVANTLGSVAGAMLGWFGGKRQMPGRLGSDFAYQPFVAFLFACWAGLWFFPYQLAFDPIEYWRILRRLVFQSQVSFFPFFQSGARWMALALLMEALIGPPGTRLLFGAFVASALFFHTWTGTAQVTNEHVWSAAAAVLVWCTFLWRRTYRAQAVAVLTILAVALDALSPFQFSAAGRSFQWVPFTSFVHAPRGSATYAMFAKLFLYGAMLWTTMRGGWPWLRTVASGVVFVLVLRMAQVFLPGRSAEITDALMVVALGILLKWFGVESGFQQGCKPERALGFRRRDEAVPYASHSD